ncbi:hypothetical protein BH24ACT3_BH24ACT3_07330 [soil metagenome]
MTQSHQEVAVARSITKADLLDKVSNQAGVSKAQAENVLSAFFGTATSAAQAGNKVGWPGFGSFQGRQQAARTGRNPRTGKSMPVKAKKVMKFTASSTLKDTLNSKRKAAAKKAPAKKKAAAKRSTAKKTTAKNAPAKRTTAKKAAKKR